MARARHVIDRQRHAVDIDGEALRAPVLVDERRAHRLFVRETQVLVEKAQRYGGAALISSRVFHAQWQRHLFEIIARCQQLFLVNVEDHALATREGDDVHKARGGKPCELADPLPALDAPLVFRGLLAAPRARIARDGEIFAANFRDGHAGAVIAHDDGLFRQRLWQRDPDIVGISVPRIIDELFQGGFGRTVGLAEQCGKARVHREMCACLHASRQRAESLGPCPIYPAGAALSFSGAVSCDWV